MISDKQYRFDVFLTETVVVSRSTQETIRRRKQNSFVIVGLIPFIVLIIVGVQSINQSVNQTINRSISHVLRKGSSWEICHQLLENTTSTTAKYFILGENNSFFLKKHLFMISTGGPFSPLKRSLPYGRECSLWDKLLNTIRT